MARRHTTDKPTEFGGKEQRSGIQPRIRPDGKPGHEPTASEKMRLQKQTAQDLDTGKLPESDRASYEGLWPRDIAEEIRKQSGDLDKGVD